MLTYDSNWKIAKKKLQVLLEKLLEEDLQIIKKDMKRAKKNLLISYTNVTPIIYTEGKDSGINLTIRYLCKPKDRRGSATLLWENILDLVDNSKVMDLAYPSSTVFLSK
tara:strand:- start:755 stop:1081 length:327 start_codon:yes stop_codon:yes gene_type:complete